MNNGELTAKQKRFCEEYLIDTNATQAAIRARYSKKTAYSIGGENLKKPEIHKYIRSLMEQRSFRTQVTADRILEELAKIAFAEEGEKTRDKLKAMDMLARREGFYDKQSLEFPEFPDPDVKREAYLEAISQKERPALAISSLLCPMDRERVRKALEKRLEEEKHSKPTKAAESALEESGNGEDEQDDFDLIKIMKDELGEERIKRIVQEKIESLLSSWQ